MLGQLFPPLQTYCPILPRISEQQALWLLLDCTEAFYGGAVGGGKTAALLMAALQYVDVPGYSALILRRTFPELEQPDGPIPQSIRWFSEAPEAIRPTYNRSDHEWSFPSGAVIRFGHLDHQNSMIRYQGGGYHFFGFDELTHFDEQSYEFIGFSRTRRPPDGPLSQVPMRVRATANPGGPGHMWVKKRFIRERKPDVVFIPSKLKDNPGIDFDDYVSRLDKLSPTLRDQLLEGNWDAIEGAAYEEFKAETHCVPRMVIPDSWDRFESMDVGTTAPTAWYAFANDYDANLIVFDGRYTPGTPEDHAPVILEYRKAERLGGRGWERLDNGFPVRHNAYGDPASLRESLPVRNAFGQALTLQEHYQNLGVRLIPANNRRQIGYLEVRSRIRCDPLRRFPNWHPKAGEYGSPRIFFVGENVPELVEQLQAAPLEPLEKRLGGEAVDGEWESQYGHAHAALRYGVTTRPVASLEPEPVPETVEELRTAKLREWDSPTDFDDEPSGFVTA